MYDYLEAVRELELVCFSQIDIMERRYKEPFAHLDSLDLSGITPDNIKFGFAYGAEWLARNDLRNALENLNNARSKLLEELSENV